MGLSESFMKTIVFLFFIISFSELHVRGIYLKKIDKLS